MLEAGEVARTMSPDLRVRSQPWVGDDSIKYVPVLPLGTELVVLDGEPWIQRAKPSRQALHGTGTAMIDGVLSPGEWDRAARIPIEIVVPPEEDGNLVSGTLLVMNDGSNLYLAVTLPGAYDRTSTWYAFDADDDEDFKDAGDLLVAAFYGGPPRTGGVTVVEVSHPLASGDDAHDFQLAADDMIGFSLEVVLRVGTGSAEQTSISDPGPFRFLIEAG